MKMGTFVGKVLAIDEISVNLTKINATRIKIRTETVRLSSDPLLEFDSLKEYKIVIYALILPEETRTKVEMGANNELGLVKRTGLKSMNQ